jgi:23S rRNA (cytidine1920-2'-O)/16S rRNA (cytidine1409-2'-O)-methyltransferase
MRLDQLLVERKLAASRTLAQKLIESGVVTVNSVVTTKPSRKMEGNESIEVTQQMPFISRGGEKLDCDVSMLEPRLEVLPIVCSSAGQSGYFVWIPVLTNFTKRYVTIHKWPLKKGVMLVL